MAKSILGSHDFVSQNANVTRYYHLASDASNAWTTEANAQLNIRPAGTFTYVTILVESNGTNPASTLRLRINGANGNGAASIPAATTGRFQDTSSPDTVAAGDNVNFSLTTGTAGTSLSLNYLSVVFEPTDTNVTVTKFCFNNLSTSAQSAHRFAPVNGGGSGTTIESIAQTTFKKAGTLKYLDVVISTNQRASTTTAQVRKNGANGNCSVSIPLATTGVFENTSSTDTVAVDDLICVSFLTGTGTAVIIQADSVSISFESADRVVPLISATATGNAMSASTTNHLPIFAKTNPTSGGSRSDIKVDLGTGTFSNLCVIITSNTSTSAGTGFLNVANTDTALTYSVPSNTTGTFEDNTHTATLADGDIVRHKYTSGATNTTALRQCVVFLTLDAPAPPNPVLTQVVRFQKTTTATAGTTQDVSFTFDPKALIVVSDGGTTDNAFTDGWQLSQGFFDGTNKTCVCSVSDDGETTSDTASIQRNDAVIVKLTDEFTTTPTEVIRGNVAFGAAGTKKATFTWTVNNSEAIWITAIAIGGTDITNVKVATVDTGRTGAGTQDYTGLGFTCTDNNGAVFLLDGNVTATNTIAAMANNCFGFATSATQQHVVATAQEDAVGTSDTFRYISDSDCLATIGVNAAMVTVASFNSWISDGFRLSYATKTSGTTEKLSYLVIKGGKWFGGSQMCNTATGNETVTASVSGQPIRAIGTGMNGAVDAATLTQHSRHGFGYTDGTNTAWLGAVDNDAAATMINARRSSGTSRLVGYPSTGSATGSSTPMFADANLSSIGTDQFVIDHQIAPASSVMFVYWVLADGVSLTNVSTTKTHKYNIIAKVQTTKTHKFNIAPQPTPVMTQVVRFQKSTGGNGTTQEINLNFTPKAIILYSDGSINDNTVTNNYQQIQGFSDGTNHCCICASSRDNAVAGDSSYTYRDDSVYVEADDINNNNIVARGTAAFSTNKVTFTWTVNNAEAPYIHLIAYGGDDITNVKVNTVQIGRNTTGVQNYTGLGFNPNGNGKSVLFTLATTFMNTEINNIFDGAAISSGCAVSTTKRWAVSNAITFNADPTVTVSVESNDKCLYLLQPSGTLYYHADFNGWITDGFSLNYTSTPPASNLMFSYLVINGGSWDAGTSQAPASTSGNTDQTISVGGNTPRGFYFTSPSIPSLNSPSGLATISIGSTDRTNSSAIGVIDETNQATTDNYRRNTTTAVIDALDFNGANYDKAVFVDANTTSTNFRLSWTKPNSIQNYYNWVVVADGAVVTNVSTTKTHKYNIIARVTTTKTHKYHIIAKVSTTKTHKYNIIVRVTASKTHKFNILVKVSTSKTHKYNIIAKISTTKTHKYNVLVKISTTRTHKYNILAKVLTTKTHKYNIIQKVTKYSVHVYNIIAKISTTKTHKYNIIAKITTQRTHKYSILNKVSTNKTHSYNILQKVSTTKTHKYNTIAKVTATTTHKFNTIAKITVTRTHRYNIIVRVSTTKTHKFSILTKVETTKTHKYDVESPIIKVSTTKTHKYNVESALTKVETTKTHKYNVLAKVSTTKTHRFNILERVVRTRTHLYNVLQKVSTTTTHKFNTIQRVTTQKTHVFSVIQKLTVQKTHRYDIIARVEALKTHKYNILAKISTTKTHRYDVESAIFKVSTTKTHKYNIEATIENVTTTKTHKYNILQKVSTTKTHIFNVLQKVSTQKTHKYNIIGKITTSKTHKYNIIAKTNKLTIHRFNILNKVSRTRTHRYAILQRVLTTKTHKYNMIGRITRFTTHHYAMGGKVTKFTTHRFIVGAALGLRELGGSTNAVIRFPERIKIIDIIADINNVAIANIEIYPQEIRCIATATVLIEKYSHVLLLHTAETHIPEIQVKSGLVLPPIIDTIENLAVCPHIAIEILEPTPQSQAKLRSQVRLSQSINHGILRSHTQVAEDKQSIIRVASTTEITNVEQTQKIDSKANVMIPYNLGNQKIKSDKVVDPDHLHKLKTLIKLLKNSELFG